MVCATWMFYRRLRPHPVCSPSGQHLQQRAHPTPTLTGARIAPPVFQRSARVLMTLARGLLPAATGEVAATRVSQAGLSSGYQGSPDPWPGRCVAHRANGSRRDAYDGLGRLTQPSRARVFSKCVLRSRRPRYRLCASISTSPGPARGTRLMPLSSLASLRRSGTFEDLPAEHVWDRTAFAQGLENLLG